MDMPNWNHLMDEHKRMGSNFDILRRNYLRKLHKLTNRNIVIYYSGWLQKPGISSEITDEDKIGFMSTINKLDRSKGLDLLLHTQGGETAATESLVDYLRKMFGTDIRAIIPQLALSAGTMIACASKVIIMGKQSSLGPIDPQFGGIPAHGVIEEFMKAHKEIREDPSKIPVWQPIIAKYHPTFIGECQKAIQWSEKLVREWLETGMFYGKQNSAKIIDEIIQEIGSHAITLSHARHLSADKCRSIGLTIEMMEDDQKLQDAVLSVHHACMVTMSLTPAFKIIENHNGIAFIKAVAQAPMIVEAK
jgi:ATP-dependent protease ClpP protease subunit